MASILSQPAQLHRHTFKGGNGVPPPPLIVSTFSNCVRVWLEQPLQEQPFYFISLEDRPDVGYEEIAGYVKDARRSNAAGDGFP